MRIFILIIGVFVFFAGAVRVPAQQKPKEFALYLLPSLGKRPQRLHALDISKIKKPTGPPMISTADIDYYQKDRHDRAALHGGFEIKQNSG